MRPFEQAEPLAVQSAPLLWEGQEARLKRAGRPGAGGGRSLRVGELDAFDFDEVLPQDIIAGLYREQGLDLGATLAAAERLAGDYGIGRVSRRDGELLPSI
jgi:hypothetical protein